MALSSLLSSVSLVGQKCARYCALKGLLAPDDEEDGDQQRTWTKLSVVVRDIIETRCDSLADCLLKIEIMLDRVDEADHETLQMLQSLHRDLSELPQPVSQ